MKDRADDAVDWRGHGNGTQFRFGQVQLRFLHRNRGPQRIYRDHRKIVAVGELQRLQVFFTLVDKFGQIFDFTSQTILESLLPDRKPVQRLFVFE